jgi:hypothetical protein
MEAKPSGINYKHKIYLKRQLCVHQKWEWSNPIIRVLNDPLLSISGCVAVGGYKTESSSSREKNQGKMALAIMVK